MRFPPRLKPHRLSGPLMYELKLVPFKAALDVSTEVRAYLRGNGKSKSFERGGRKGKTHPSASSGLAEVSRPAGGPFIAFFAMGGVWGVPGWVIRGAGGLLRSNEHFARREWSA